MRITQIVYLLKLYVDVSENSMISNSFLNPLVSARSIGY